MAARALRFGRRAFAEVFPYRGMPLRRRVSLAAALAVAAAVALAVIVCYVAVSYRLSSSLDGELRSQARYDVNYILADGIPPNPENLMAPAYSAARGGAAPYAQYVLSEGETIAPGAGQLRVTPTIRAIAAGAHPAAFSVTSFHGTKIRVYTVYIGQANTASGVQGVALVLGRPLSSNASLLHELRLILLVVLLFAVPLAALFGRFAARRVLRPLAEVTSTADLIAETDDLSQRIAVREDDEVGVLAARFNAMLERLGASRAELDESVRSQRQLVADASHELRTPVTSLRTNVEVLLASASLDPADRVLLEDVLEQSEELSTLVADLIEVARGELPSDSLDDVRLDRLVEDALHRARRNAPGLEYRAELAPMVVQGNPERLARAVNNLLDNAAKHAGTGPVEVRVDPVGLTVRDHGSGIDPSDLPYIFDRFYRGINSRSSQGSGLGLAIVRQTALLHGGSVSAINAAEGDGAIFTLALPTSVPAEQDDAPGADDTAAPAGLRT